jgi:hypothetical protein
MEFIWIDRVDEAVEAALENTTTPEIDSGAVRHLMDAQPGQ